MLSWRKGLSIIEKPCQYFRCQIMTENWFIWLTLSWYMKKLSKFASKQFLALQCYPFTMSLSRWRFTQKKRRVHFINPSPIHTSKPSIPQPTTNKNTKLSIVSLTHNHGLSLISHRPSIVWKHHFFTCKTHCNKTYCNFPLFLWTWRTTLIPGEFWCRF